MAKPLADLVVGNDFWYGRYSWSKSYPVLKYYVTSPID
jgi:hypothetical protein